MSDLAPRVAALRGFNRFYTRHVGALRDGLLDSPFPLTEARVLHELAQGPPRPAAALARELGLDPGQLSRILQRFATEGLVVRAPMPGDRRQALLALTEAGRAAFVLLDARSEAESSAVLARLPEPRQRRLVDAMETVANLLAADPAAPPVVLLRNHRPGDIGWVISRHAGLYAKEYGFDASFEALVAEIAGGFLARFEPSAECCRIAELDGERAGSVFLVRESGAVAKLRLLIVEPWARGHGIGHRLVADCIAFARDCGYARLTLWTNDCLHAARRIYEAAGFTLEREEPHRSFGCDLVGQYWSLPLR